MASQAAATPGEYQIAYNAVDSYGNPAATVTRTVTVADATPIPLPYAGSGTTAGYADDYDEQGNYIYSDAD